jgi:large subunit ribosomal protein L30
VRAMPKKKKNEIKITLTRSVIGSNKKQIATVVALGLKKTNSSIIKVDNDQIRGMINVVSHLVIVENV